MDAKITLSFDANVIAAAKQYAEQNNISLSRLTEFIFKKMTNEHAGSIEELPIADWISLVSEGEAVYQRMPPSRKTNKKEFFDHKKS